MRRTMGRYLAGVALINRRKNAKPRAAIWPLAWEFERFWSERAVIVARLRRGGESGPGATELGLCDSGKSWTLPAPWRLFRTLGQTP